MGIRKKIAIGTDNPVLRAIKRFGQYKDEKEQKIRDFCPKSSEGLENISEAWMVLVHFPNMDQLFHDISNPRYYTREAIAGKSYSAEDISAFAIMISAFIEEPVFRGAGQFLSTIINDSEEAEFHIVTRGIAAAIDLLGYQNTKQLIIDGDAGMWLGKDMHSGSILLKGDCGDSAGDLMRNGTIIIEGDSGANVGGNLIKGSIIVKGSVGYGAGYQMHGGKVEIIGNAADNAGHHMTGGELEIHGNAGSSVGSFITGGTITVHGDVGDYLGGFRKEKGPYPTGMIPNMMDSILRTARIMARMSKSGFQVSLPAPPKNTGEIIVLGNAGEAVGENMKGGTIRIYGEFKSLGKDIKGRVYHNGKLIAGE